MIVRVFYRVVFMQKKKISFIWRICGPEKLNENRMVLEKKNTSFLDF